MITFLRVQQATEIVTKFPNEAIRSVTNDMMLGFAKKGDADPYCLTVDNVFDEWIRLWKKTMVAVGPPVKLIPDAEDIQRVMRASVASEQMRTEYKDREPTKLGPTEMEMMQKEMKDLRSQLVQVKNENAKLKQALEAGGQGSGYPGKFQKTQGIGGGGQYNSRVGYGGVRENRAVPYKRGQGWGNGPYPPQTQQHRQHQHEEDERKETGYYCRVGGRDEVMEDHRFERASFGRARTRI
jgi:hypothetical protein